MSQQNQKFWQTKSLEQMTEREWESLCDGCGKCCLVRLQDQETDEIYNTTVCCKLLNTQTCRCTDYENRKKHVPDCLILRPLNKFLLSLLPDTCAYRLLAENKTLPDWHPLVSGSADSIKEAGISVAGKVINEKFIHPDELENYVID